MKDEDGTSYIVRIYAQERADGTGKYPQNGEPQAEYCTQHCKLNLNFLLPWTFNEQTRRFADGERQIVWRSIRFATIDNRKMYEFQRIPIIQMFRSQCGDDSELNLITLCAICHEQVHRNRQRSIEQIWFRKTKRAF